MHTQIIVQVNIMLAPRSESIHMCVCVRARVIKDYTLVCIYVCVCIYIYTDI